jgi:glycerophosphoryl diester phosphodiesterase
VIGIPLLLLALWIGAHLLLRTPPRRPPYGISHRGAAAFAPENTLAGIREAIARGASHVEIDVQRTADGALVVLHDERVDRTTDGHGAVGELTLAELRALDAGKGERIPTLDEVLDLVAAAPIELVLEAKHPARYPGIDAQIAAALGRTDLEGRVLVISFDRRWLRRFHQVAPGIDLGDLYVWKGPWEGERVARLVGVFWGSVLADPTLIWRAHRRGYEVGAWTIDRAWCMRLLLWLGVDAVTTNRPDLWARAIECTKRSVTSSDSRS